MDTLSYRNHMCKYLFGVPQPVPTVSKFLAFVAKKAVTIQSLCGVRSHLTEVNITE